MASSPSSDALAGQSSQAENASLLSDVSDERLPDMLFEEFVPQLEKSLPQLFHDIGYSYEDIEYLAAGVYNVVFSFKRSTSSGPEDLVIRVVIQDGNPCREILERNVTLVKYLQDKDLHVPEVIHYDATHNNAIKRAYIIMKRAHGQPLEDIYHDLNRADKLDLMDQLAQQISKHEQITFRRMGDFRELCVSELLAGTSDKAENFLPLNLPDVTVPCGPGDLYELLLKLFDVRISEEHRDPKKRSRVIRRFKRLKKMATEMNAQSYFEGFTTTEDVVLNHNDLHFHNILVQQEGEKWRLSAILDWDEANARPRVLARHSLLYAWTQAPWEKGDLLPSWNENEDFVPEEFLHKHISLEENELKESIDALMTKYLPGYMEETYGRGLWARRIAHFAIQGFDLHPDDHKAGAWLLQEWARKQGRPFQRFILGRIAWIDQWTAWLEHDLPLHWDIFQHNRRYFLKRWLKRGTKCAKCW